MKLSIARQDSYSKGDLIVRTLFGYFYIGIPHMIAMIPAQIYALIIQCLLFWVLLFTGKFPQAWHEHLVKYFKWNLRLSAVLWNMIEGRPEIGINKESSKVTLELPYTAEIDRGKVILRYILGSITVGIPHGFCIYFRMMGQMIVNMLAFLSLLFKGTYPENLFKFSEGTFRWSMAISAYMLFMTDKYPKFSGNQD